MFAPHVQPAAKYRLYFTIFDGGMDFVYHSNRLAGAACVPPKQVSLLVLADDFPGYPACDFVQPCAFIFLLEVFQKHILKDFHQGDRAECPNALLGGHLCRNLARHWGVTAKCVHVPPGDEAPHVAGPLFQAFGGNLPKQAARAKRA